MHPLWYVTGVVCLAGILMAIFNVIVAYQNAKLKRKKELYEEEFRKLHARLERMFNEPN